MIDGFSYLVGAGPGATGLLTLRGREVLSIADAVICDHLAIATMPDFAPPASQRIYVGKQASAHTMQKEEIDSLLVLLGKDGRQVVRLGGGDPFVLGRGSEEALALAEASASFEVVCRATSGVAALACAGIPVTHCGLASMGPQTSAASRESGLEPTVEARSHTVPALAEAMPEIDNPGRAGK